ncbi:RNA-binding domain-containing protein [Salinarimonas rosea]|uniref:RNA-binding domain-containing protein n=1 Tax=Salinarimonas rosea TaxID=552063 RepID=UPI00040DFAE3|nr:RNA-binding domain-containing protein [Salinarimonas rosea]
MSARSEAVTALRRIAKGAKAGDLESQTLDFKEDKAGRSEIDRVVAEAAICFANSAGGVVVIGVSDKARGLDALTGTAVDPDHLRQRVFELTSPPLSVTVERFEDRPDILLAIVPQSPEIHADTKGRATQRINKDCLPVMPVDYQRLREEKQGVDWSAGSLEIGLHHLDPEALATARRLLARFSDERRLLATRSDADLLRAVGALDPQGRVTRAGALMFAPPTFESDELVYQYRATPGGEPRTVQRLRAPLVIAFQRVMDLVEARQTLTPITLPNGQQFSLADFPTLAVREVISNAICHRDYTRRGATLIEHSPEVFSIASPGPLVAGVTVDNILTTASRPRNAALTRMARTLGLAEELGRGVDRIYRELIKAGRGLPRIEAQVDQVRFVFVGGAVNTQVARFFATLPDDERDDTDMTLVVHRLCSAKTVSATDLTRLLQKPEYEVQAVLRRLATDEIGLIEPTRATARRAAPTYRLRAEALRQLGSAVVYQRRTTDDIDRKIIAHVDEYGRITNSTIQNMLDVHVFKSRDIIADLVDRQILTRISTQTRGPRVEWGPGEKFPQRKRRAASKRTPPDQGTLFDRDE